MSVPAWGRKCGNCKKQLQVFELKHAPQRQPEQQQWKKKNLRNTSLPRRNKRSETPAMLQAALQRHAWRQVARARLWRTNAQHWQQNAPSCGRLKLRTPRLP
jgi:hypothetical protein